MQAKEDPLYFATYKALGTFQPYVAGSIRFKGVYTDGGCDEALRQYWVSIFRILCWGAIGFPK